MGGEQLVEKNDLISLSYTTQFSLKIIMELFTFTSKQTLDGYGLKDF